MKQSRRNIFKIIGLSIVSMLMLTGCSNSEKRAELEAYVKRIKSRNITEIEPLPEVKPYETFTYSASNLRSPFTPSFPEEATKKMAEGTNGIQPDSNRRREALEAYPIDSLRMVGTLEKNKRKWALVVSPDGAVYRITKGNYLGQNHGRIEDVTEENLSITEIIPDVSGGWRERKVSIALNQVDKTKKNAPHKDK
jgi:type IV pilus assembly protein PilP